LSRGGNYLLRVFSLALETGTTIYAASGRPRYLPSLFALQSPCICQRVNRDIALCRPL
jgi:hypothetical protein